jgi:hypothetical protein
MKLVRLCDERCNGIISIKWGYFGAPLILRDAEWRKVH